MSVEPSAGLSPVEEQLHDQLTRVLRAYLRETGDVPSAVSAALMCAADLVVMAAGTIGQDRLVVEALTRPLSRAFETACLTHPSLSRGGAAAPNPSPGS